MPSLAPSKNNPLKSKIKSIKYGAVAVNRVIFPLILTPLAIHKKQINYDRQ
jgi:hypothetical protein